MENLFPPTEAAQQKRRVYSVSEISQDVKLVLEGTFGQIWVEGEVSNFSASAAGHLYFSLKDDQAVLAAVIFSRAAKDVKFKIENGLKVICCGTVTAYGPRSQYQVIIEAVEPKGVGSLQLAFEQLKQRLEKEGLFSPDRKRPIPYLPGRIGVVTSLQGAALKDMLKVLERRFKDIEIIVSPVKVQGEGAREEIAQAVHDFNLFNQELPAYKKIEVLIVGRGGGSIEDLWAFNEEIVARSIAASRIPVISAVGHERDVTIADLVADLRAATPSVAAELVIPRKEDLREKVADLEQGLRRAFREDVLAFGEERAALEHRLALAVGHLFDLNRSRLEAAAKKLGILNPAAAIREHQKRIADLARQIYVRLVHYVELKNSRFVKAAEKLAGLSPLNILSRGYSITFTVPGGGVVRDTRQLSRGDTIRTRFHRGEVVSQITEVKQHGGD